ncbi:MAG TPA: M48 family metallopeptidase [Pyrinomonadaceae bacterium]|nr:M48 family metallopeptidase [Pyrinomonadaceae bacterium]
MHYRLFRSLTATGLVFSLWAGSIAAVAAPRQDAQKTVAAAKDKDAKDSSDKNNKDKKGDKDEQTAAAQPSNPGKPLSEKEDPRLIGKRKINGGFIASISGGMDKEVNLGRQLAAEVDRQAKFIDDPVITEYINRVGQNIVLHSDARIPFTIKVIDSDEVNAFALPGGFFYVNKGLILAADNEAEVAGVMAHEIAHVAARHAMENQAKGMLAQIGLTAGSIFLGGLAGMAILNGAQFGALLGFMKFSRSAESEADMLGVQYLWAAGYDPNAMSTMFEKLAAKNKKKPGTFSKLFETHPQSIDRMEATRALVARFPDKEEYVLSTSEFQRVKNRLLRLSNARASTAGDISPDGNGAPGRPTLKRRSPGADDSTNDDGTTKPEEKKSDAPQLKRRTDDQQQTPQNPPE